MDPAADHKVEAILTDELARESRALAAVVPVLHHMLSSQTQSLVSDAIVARVRGMIWDLAAQVEAAKAGRDPAVRMPTIADPDALDALADRLMGDSTLLTFCHAMAAESLMAERLQQRRGIDPVLSPLVQELIATDDPAIGSLAMSALAAQSRFIQSQRRMELPLAELPAELFHRLIAAAHDEGGDAAMLTRLRAQYDEATGRTGLLARLVAAMRRGALAALELDHAGLALFASALSEATDQPRAEAVLACHDGQLMRLAMLLRASGLDALAIERQLLLLDPSTVLPRGLAALTPERALALLGGRGGFAG